MKRIHILRPGTFSSVSAGDITLTRQDLIDLAASFDSSRSKAPIVVGHPKLNSPAFGWVKALSSDANGNVFVEPEQVNPQFAELVKGGAYKTVSASLLPPTHRSNPTPGKWSLRHVGFLGGHAPAIAGLEGVEFGADDQDVLTVEFGVWDQASGLYSAGRMFRRVRDWLIGKEGLEAADQVLPDWDVKAVEDAARLANEDASKGATSFAEQQEHTVADPKKIADLAEREQTIAAREAAVAAGEAKIAADAAATRRTGLVNFAEQLVRDNKLLPAQKTLVVELGMALNAPQAVEFGEGEAQVSTTLQDGFKTLLSGLPAGVVPLGEVAANAATAATADFAAPAGATVSADRLELHSKAVAHQRQHGGDYLTAVKAVGG